MTSIEALQAGFQQRGHPGEMLGQWMRREIAEKVARGEEAPWDLGPTVPLHELTAMKADNDRLRALLLKAEWGSCNCGSDPEPSGCPFCSGDTYGSAYDERQPYAHDVDCEGYSARGVVR